MHLFLHDFSLLGALSTLDALSRRAVEMTLRDPALVISLLGQCTSRDSWSISTNDRHLLLGVKCLLGSGRGTLCALATFSAALQLWEEGLDPGLVDEVQGSSECGEEEEVEENAGRRG